MKKLWRKKKSTDPTKGEALTSNTKQGRTQYPHFFLVETEKDTVWRDRSAVVKAELQSPSKADKPATFTHTASYHAGQDPEEMTGPSQRPGTITEAPMQPVCSQTAPLLSQLP